MHNQMLSFMVHSRGMDERGQEVALQYVMEENRVLGEQLGGRRMDSPIARDDDWQ